MIIITAYTRHRRMYIRTYTAIASRQPRSSVPAAIYIVFIALRAVSIHFYHCFTVYTFPIYLFNIYKPYSIYYYYFLSPIYSQSHVRKPISTTGRMSTSGTLLLYRHRRLKNSGVYSLDSGILLPHP